MAQAFPRATYLPSLFCCEVLNCFAQAERCKKPWWCLIIANGIALHCFFLFIHKITKIVIKESSYFDGNSCFAVLSTLNYYFYLLCLYLGMRKLKETLQHVGSFAYLNALRNKSNFCILYLSCAQTNYYWHKILCLLDKCVICVQ